MLAIEVRRVNGEPYPPNSLCYMFCGILRYMTQVFFIEGQSQISKSFTTPSMEFSRNSERKVLVLHQSMPSHLITKEEK